jgi:tetratricopeptide (TPR) repeat protein
MSALDQARTHFEAGEFGKAREAAAEGLASNPDDLELLRVAGRAGVETGADDAAGQLRRVTELQPDSAAAWRDLADALAAEGDSAGAEQAFRKVLELEPEDEAAMSALGHTAFQAGRRDDGVALLEQAAERAGGGASTVHVSLVDMYRAVGQPAEALAAARKILEADPDNALAALDVAELSLEVGNEDDALAAFDRLREISEFPEDEVAALHGMIKVELGRDGEQAALELARQAVATDTVGTSTAVLAHLEAATGSGGGAEDDIPRGQSVAFIQAQEAPPSRADVDALINATIGELRRKLMEESRRIGSDEFLG